MMRALQTERAKAKGKFMYAPVLVVLAVQLVYVLWGYLRFQSSDDYTYAWQFFLYQLSALNCILLPITIVMMASRLADLEHKGETFRLLQTLQSPGALFRAKVLRGITYMLVLALLQAGMLLTVGVLFHFGTIPWGALGWYLFSTFAVSACLYLLAQVLALLVRNQSVTLIAGVCSSLLGLMALFFPPAVQRVVLVAYYGMLSNVRLLWNPDTRVSQYIWSSLDYSALFTLVMLFCVLYLIGKTLLKRKEY